VASKNPLTTEALMCLGKETQDPKAIIVQIIEREILRITGVGEKVTLQNYFLKMMLENPMKDGHPSPQEIIILILSLGISLIEVMEILKTNLFGATQAMGKVNFPHLNQRVN
jgi:hypothetical protein